MPLNPIQRKTRNSFLAGMLIMLLISVIIGAVLYLFIFADATGGNIKTGGTVNVYRLKDTVKSGEEITPAKFEVVKYYVSDLPADYIEGSINVTGLKSKLELKAGTVLTGSLVYKGEGVANSTRLMEYNMLTLPSNLRIGDYVDVRFTMPSGQDYIVLSKKEVKNIRNTTVTFFLTEDEILMMSSAIIESYVMKASNLYVDQYVAAGVQEAATPTYSVNSQVYQLILSNSEKGFNIEDYTKINDSYNSNLRNIIEQELGVYSETKQDNLQEGMDKQKQQSMELYLSGLAGY